MTGRGCERCVSCQSQRVGSGGEDWDEKSQEGARASESAAAAWYISNQERWCTGGSGGGRKGGGVGRRWLQGSAGHEGKRKLKGGGGEEEGLRVASRGHHL
jgi:hypothetical protein